MNHSKDPGSLLNNQYFMESKGPGFVSCLKMGSKKCGWLNRPLEWFFLTSLGLDSILVWLGMCFC